MACRKCKKNAKTVIEGLKESFNIKKPKPKTECVKGREEEQDWMNNSEEGKRLSALAKPNRLESILLVVFAWIPLIVGYISIIRFLISLF